MEILTIPFETPVFINIKGAKVRLLLFKTTEQSNVKFGINAPRSIEVHREEIYYAIKKHPNPTHE